MRTLRNTSLHLTACATICLVGGCRNHAAFTGIEHQNLNLEGSQVSWVPHTELRGQFGTTFTGWQAPSITSTGVTVANADGTHSSEPIELTQNPTPITVNHIHGPTNTIALGQKYRPTGQKPAY